MYDRRTGWSQGVSKGPPFGLLGLFQRHVVLRFGKSPNRLWLFCGGKAAGAERPIVGGISMMCPTAGADVEREPTVRRPCAPGGILPNPIGRTEAERLNNYTALTIMAAVTIA